MSELTSRQLSGPIVFVIVVDDAFASGEVAATAAASEALRVCKVVEVMELVIAVVVAVGLIEVVAVVVMTAGPLGGPQSS